MATRLDIITLALRDIGVVARDEAASADDVSFVGSVLDSVFAEIENEFDVTWTIETVPTVSAWALARLLGVDIAPSFDMAPRETRARAWRRFFSTVRSDNRADFRDLDDSGTISTEEADAGLRAAYY